jgi:hypothetical protein
MYLYNYLCIYLQLILRSYQVLRLYTTFRKAVNACFNNCHFSKDLDEVNRKLERGEGMLKFYFCSIALSFSYVIY